MLLPLSLSSVSKDLFPLPHFTTEPKVCLIQYKTGYNKAARSVLYIYCLHHGSLIPHCSGGRRYSLPASLEDWQASKASPSRSTNTTVDWQPSPGMNGEFTLLPRRG
jgi:hypothetical protein